MVATTGRVAARNADNAPLAVTSAADDTQVVVRYADEGQAVLLLDDFSEVNANIIRVFGYPVILATLGTALAVQIRDTFFEPPSPSELDFSNLTIPSTAAGASSAQWGIDGVGKVTGTLPNPQDLTPEEKEELIDALEDSIPQREREQARYPKGSDDWEGHQDRIDREKELLKELKKGRGVLDILDNLFN